MVDGTKKRLSELKEKADAEGPVAAEKARVAAAGLKEASAMKAPVLAVVEKVYTASTFAFWLSWGEAAPGRGEGGGGVRGLRVGDTPPRWG
jgi:hypothetical protein